MHRSPWPATAARREADGVLTVGGVAVTDLAAEHGTPLWVVDEADLRERCRRYRDAFPGVWVAYASKAWCTTGILQVVADEGLWIDVASGGELHTAVHAGVPMDRVVFHGNNKSVAELTQAVRTGVARIVVDSLTELARLGRVAREHDVTVPVWLRITPGIDAHTHQFVRTGQDDSKFGFTLSLGLADEGFAAAMDTDGVEVVGAHAHIGSQIFGTDPFVANAEVLVELLARWRDEHGVLVGELNLGGGMGIRYTHEDHPVRISRYGEAVVRAVEDACEDHDVPVPQLAVEPGRAIVGPSTLTLYEVGTVKRLPALRTYVSVDGGMSDNIRPALYDAEHEVELASRESTQPPAAVSVVGKHCESGDLVAERTRLPEDVREGDLLAVAATGAYGEAMASNYNRLPRPGAVIVADGQVRQLVRRETVHDVVARDVSLVVPPTVGSTSLTSVARGDLDGLDRLGVAEHQQDRVAPNASTLARAAYEAGSHVFAIRDDGLLVGLLAAIDQRRPATRDECPDATDDVHLWRLMVGADHQGNGIGRRAVQSFLGWARARGHVTASLSVAPDNDEAIGLCTSLGFVDTGRVDDGEAVYVADLTDEVVPTTVGSVATP